MFHDSVAWLSGHGVSATAVGTAIAFVFSVFQFVSVRKAEARAREFDKYHQLIERLVSPDEKGQMFLDRQVAVIFELRHFLRYYECMERILGGLQEAWRDRGDVDLTRLLVEIELTLAHIRKRRARLSL